MIRVELATFPARPRPRAMRSPGLKRRIGCGGCGSKNRRATREFSAEQIGLAAADILRLRRHRKVGEES